MIVYRSGAVTADNFTPRPGKDTAGQAGKPPGLSTFETISALHLVPSSKVQQIDLDLLQSPLKPFSDDPMQGGTIGHVAIAPGDEQGNVDQKLLEEWAACRRTGTCHTFTQFVLDAVTKIDIRS